MMILPKYRHCRATVAVLILSTASAWAQADRTLPIAPKVAESPLPPAVTLPAPPQAQKDVPNRPLTAQEAVALALRHQAVVAAAQGSALAARGRTEQAASALLPALTLTSAYTDNSTMSGTGASSSSGSSSGSSSSTGNTFQETATVRQLLFDFQHTRDLVRQANAQQQAAECGLDKVQSDLVLQVKQAFYALAQDTRLVAVNETDLRNAGDHLALAKARLDAGMGLPSDVVRAETAVSEAALNLSLARNNASLAGVTLANAMGIDVRTPLTAAECDEPALEGDDVNGLIATALRRRPEVLQAQASLDATQAGSRAARTTNAPAVNANVGVTAKDNAFFPQSSSLTVGATITWNAFDAGSTAGRIREAEGNVETARAQLVTAQQNVAVDVAQAYLNMRSAEQRVTTSEAEVANAEESVRLSEGRYRAGIGTFLEVTDAQSALLSARTNRVNAQAAVNVARAALAHATGTGRI